jgi:hypothetical protein
LDSLEDRLEVVNLSTANSVPYAQVVGFCAVMFGTVIRTDRPPLPIPPPPPYPNASNKIPSAASRSGVTRRSALTCLRAGTRIAGSDGGCPR